MKFCSLRHKIFPQWSSILKQHKTFLINNYNFTILEGVWREELELKLFMAQNKIHEQKKIIIKKRQRV